MSVLTSNTVSISFTVTDFCWSLSQSWGVRYRITGAIFKKLDVLMSPS